MDWSVYKPNRATREFYEKLGAKILDDEDHMYIEVEKFKDMKRQDGGGT
jgi:hypothetical protein